MIEIPLTQGQVALVDDEDYEKVKNYHWYAHKDGYVFYAETQIKQQNGKQKPLQMHTLLIQKEIGQEIDHKNRNGCDNRKENLRVCSRSENLMNRLSWGSSIYKGVCWYKRHSLWTAYIDKDKKRYNLGYFKEEKDAAKAYNEAALLYHGEFAYLNEIGD